MSYKEVAYEVMKLMLDDFTEEELKACIDKAYDEKFDTDVIAPLVKADGAYYLELFHGATIALPMLREHVLLYFNLRMVSARFRRSRWLPRRVIIHM